ncbi:MAG TPA: Gldg family protein [Gammaproteobacteria bacterium]|nr:Gldg family protein [Gammaproteobacteria bacterium]
MDKVLDKILRIARKEFTGFFASPVAFIFLGAFLAVTLFTFFWVETFFSRNIADVRPLFEWMPVLLIFLAAAITMRMWAEERRAGTLEFLLTTPVPPVSFVLGKFVACLGLVAVALALTLPLPITISLIGNLDWGPVVGGYIATLFLAAAYIAIGLFISSRSDNQIVSLILTSVICGLLYLSGSTALTELFGNRGGEFLRLLGSGSRFESIARGVVDFRDLYYYLSLVGLFLTLNVFMLEWLRWAGNRKNESHKRWGLATALLGANFLAANLWLTPISWARADLTQGNVYSISDATKGYIDQLREPLLIRGYFSAQTHPYLAPLVPQLRDLLKEYEIAGKGRIKVEIVDPADDPKLEEEAGQQYGIKPEPFQTSSKYQASIVNSYFDILVKYGDQHETLGFRNLIEYKATGPDDIDVRLRNPEYDVTQAIKKVLTAYQASGQLFSNIDKPVHFKGYISPDNKLPEELVAAKKTLQGLLDDYKKEAGDKLDVEIVDPDAFGGALGEKLQTDYGFRPMWTGLVGGKIFWFYMVLESDGVTAQIPLTGNPTKSALDDGIKTALKRFSKGFIKTVAMYVPEKAPEEQPAASSTSDFKWLKTLLEEQYAVVESDLKNGYVPENADLLLLAAPRNLNENQLFAIDQFLMQGGSVVIAASPYDVGVEKSVAIWKSDTGLTDWLKHNGIEISEKLVEDSQNSPFPVPVQRNIGGFTVQEMHMIDYPYFVDIREGADEGTESGILSGLNQVTMNWPSPLSIDSELNKSRRVLPLLYSSKNSWTSTDTTLVSPDFNNRNDGGFVQGEPEGKQLLAAAVEGQFESYFKGKESPLTKAGAGSDNKLALGRIIEKSPDSSRIILFGSTGFISDQILNLESRSLGTQYINPAQLVANSIDWSLEERALLSIRGRANFSRMLEPMSKDVQMFWEYLNYGLGLLGLVVVWLLRRRADKKTRIRYTAVLTG